MSAVGGVFVTQPNGLNRPPLRQPVLAVAAEASGSVPLAACPCHGRGIQTEVCGG